MCFAGHVNPDDPAVIDRVLTEPGRWAVVGLSTNRDRAAFGVSAYVQGLGHEIVPVHPRAETVHGAQGYPTLAEVPGRIDVVDVFVQSALAGAIIDQAIAVGARTVWLQLGVHDAEAEERARAAGLEVITDTCPKIEGPARGLTRTPGQS
jgi:predicted CoA-binding protein